MFKGVYLCEVRVVSSVGGCVLVDQSSLLCHGTGEPVGALACCVCVGGAGHALAASYYTAYLPGQRS